MDSQCSVCICVMKKWIYRSRVRNRALCTDCPLMKHAHVWWMNIKRTHSFPAFSGLLLLLLNTLEMLCSFSQTRDGEGV